MELLFRAEGANLPFTLLRYMQSSDKLLYEFIMAYYMEAEVTHGACTVIRPDDKVLKDLIASIRKVVKNPDSPDIEDPTFIKALKAGRAYVLRGGITKDKIHQSNWYGSFGGRAHVIYMDVPNRTIYFHNELITDQSKKFTGPSAKLEVVSSTGSSIFRLAEGLTMPSGVDPKPRPDGPRKPMGSPLARIKMEKRQGAELVGGCITCDLFGGEIPYGSRRDIMKAFVEGDPEAGLPAFGPEKWADAFMATFGPFVMKEKCWPAVSALLTGNSLADSIILLDAAAEDEARSERAPEDRPKLIPDEVFARFVETLREGVKENPSNFYADLNQTGASVEYARARAKFLENGKASKEDFMKVTNELAAKNTFHGSGPVFPKEAYEYLKETFGEELPAFLRWANMTFYYVSMMEKTPEDPYSIVVAMIPGRYRDFEVSRAISDESTVQGLYQGGFMGYVRSSIDAISAIGTRQDGQRLIIGGGIRSIDSDYRTFRIMPKKKKTPAKKEKKMIKKAIKKKMSVEERNELKKMKKAARKKASPEDAAKLKIAAAKKKKASLKKKMTKTPKRRANESDSAYAKRVTDRKKKIAIKLTKLKKKKAIKKLRADDSAESKIARENLEIEVSKLEDELEEIEESIDARLLAESKLDAVARRKAKRTVAATSSPVAATSAAAKKPKPKAKPKSKKIAKKVAKKVVAKKIKAEDVMDAIKKKINKKITRRKAYLEASPEEMAAMVRKKVVKKDTKRKKKAESMTDAELEARMKKKVAKKPIRAEEMDAVVKKKIAKRKSPRSAEQVDAVVKKKVAKKKKAIEMDAESVDALAKKIHKKVTKKVTKPKRREVDKATKKAKKAKALADILSA